MFHSAPLYFLSVRIGTRLSAFTCLPSILMVRLRPPGMRAGIAGPFLRPPAPNYVSNPALFRFLERVAQKRM